MSRRLPVFLAVFLLIGCMPSIPDVVTHEVAEPVPLGTVRIATSVSPRLQSFRTAMDEAMRQEMSARGLTASIGDEGLSGASGGKLSWQPPSDSVDVLAARVGAEIPAAQQNEADAVLLIYEMAHATELRRHDASGWGYDPGTAEDVYVFEARLVNVGTEAPLWHARLQTRTSPMASVEERAHRTTQQVIAALERDGWMSPLSARLR